MFDALIPILMIFGLMVSFLWIGMMAVVAIYYIRHFWWKIKDEGQKRHEQLIAKKYGL